MVCCELVSGTGVVLRRDGRLAMERWALWSEDEKVGECYHIDLNHEEQMEILLLIMI